MYEAELYSNHNKIPFDLAEFSFKRYGHLLKFRNSTSIIDIGIGDGHVSETILLKNLPDNVEYVGCDISNVMINFVRKKPAFKGKKLILLDVTTGNLPEELVDSFDYITAFNVLHVVKDVRQALVNIYKMLKPGGVVYMNFCEFLTNDVAYYGLPKNPKWSQYDNESYCSPFYKKNQNIIEYYYKNLKEIGFDEIKCFKDNTELEESFEKYKNFLISINYVAKNVPEEERNEYLQEYIKLILEDDVVEISNGIAYFTLPHITVYARK